MAPNPCFVMDVNGDGRDDIVCGSPFFLEADPERYCNANLSPINDLSVSVAGL
jgi:hypothetical protein